MPKPNSVSAVTDFAKELLFPEDQIVIFPSTIGVTGEVHQRMGVRFENGFGRPGKKQQEVLDDLDDAQSQRTAFSFTSTMRNYMLPGQPQHRAAVQATQLERIKEGNPQAENEAEANTQQRTKMHETGYSGHGSNPFKSAFNATASERRASVERQAADAVGLMEDSASPSSKKIVLEKITAGKMDKMSEAEIASPLLREGKTNGGRHLQQSAVHTTQALDMATDGSQAGANEAGPTMNDLDMGASSQLDNEKPASVRRAEAKRGSAILNTAAAGRVEGKRPRPGHDDVAI